METIQVVLDAKLLQAANAAAKRYKLNRSELIRRALSDHLVKLRTNELVEKDRRGYLAKPQSAEEVQFWEEAAAWPED